MASRGRRQYKPGLVLVAAVLFAGSMSGCAASSAPTDNTSAETSPSAAPTTDEPSVAPTASESVTPTPTEDPEELKLKQAWTELDIDRRNEVTYEDYAKNVALAGELLKDLAAQTSDFAQSTDNAGAADAAKVLSDLAEQVSKAAERGTEPEAIFNYQTLFQAVAPCLSIEAADLLTASGIAVLPPLEEFWQFDTERYRPYCKLPFAEGYPYVVEDYESVDVRVLQAWANLSGVIIAVAPDVWVKASIQNDARGGPNIFDAIANGSWSGRCANAERWVENLGIGRWNSCWN